MEIIIQKDSESASKAGARLIAQLIKEKPNAVLGLATGSTPLQLYRELIDMYRKGEIDFQHVTTFNLDEYVGLSSEHTMSYHYYMQNHLFQHINIKRTNINIPDGMASDIPDFCGRYETAIKNVGGIDFQILGIGTDGHIGFNEPTSSLSSRTRIKTLTEQTRTDNARFFKSISEVPRHCITMGLGTIMEAKAVLLLAFGKSKAAAMAIAIEGPVTAMCPASLLQFHPNAKMVMDEEAASHLVKGEYYKSVYAGKPDWQNNR